MTDDQLLNQTLRGEFHSPARAGLQFNDFRLTGMAGPIEHSVLSPADYGQWQVGANDTFWATGATVGLLPAGVYAIRPDPRGTVFEWREMRCGDLIELPDHATARVLAGMQKFWASEERYRRLGLIYKRGVLLWGPQGSGKTVTVHFLTRELVAADGLVFLFDNPGLTTAALQVARRVEPQRRLILVLEDIDEIIARHGEHEVLSILDGENQTYNVVHVATTNHPERLSARIVNRPSRFDERIFVPMPSRESRLKYLRTAIGRSGSELGDAEFARWVDDSEGFSIAHLRELVAGVFCLEQAYESVLERLRAMSLSPDTNLPPGGGPVSSDLRVVSLSQRPDL